MKKCEDTKHDSFLFYLIANKRMLKYEDKHVNTLEKSIIIGKAKDIKENKISRIHLSNKGVRKVYGKFYNMDGMLLTCYRSIYMDHIKKFDTDVTSYM